MMRFSKTVVSQNYGFISQIDTKPWFRKKRSRVEFLKLQKDYSFNKTMVLETIKFIVSKHPTVFSKTMVFLQYFVSKHGLKLQKILCIQTGP